MLTTQRQFLAIGLAVLALGATLGCNQRAGAANREAESDTMVASNPDADWTDAKILHATVMAHATDSALGAFASNGAQTPAVKGYAQSMVRDHGTGLQLARDVSQQGNIPLESVRMDQDNEDLANKMNELRKLQGIEFDKGYMQGEVKMHEELLKTLDDDLMTNARSAELRGYLEKIRPIVLSHLERAKTLKDELDRGRVPVGTGQE